ncbi:hypothetical protein [Streptomyces botrytidirepellens]|uniref:Uncharacterized protein n=1 Tax=Streptomyces botrytidirepellens TaxID=2486417 RepID=A0A3M8VYQ1_9ACTN|nr:hypothetical protein [Streptomyces botrytidirepellens]RNG20783.1 hypothetical protein EEJ42_23040 [Streptomyces botrytidirepellens]
MPSSATTREPGELTGPRFALFADVLAVGLATAAASLPLITAPAAMSTACAVLDRRVREDAPATAGGYLRALRARLRPGDLLAGAGMLAGGALLLFNALAAGAGLPGAVVFRPALLVVAGLLTVVLLRACARPESATSWRTALRSAAYAGVRTPGASLVLLLAVATAAVCAWAYPPLLFLVPGPLAIAARATEQHL